MENTSNKQHDSWGTKSELGLPESFQIHIHKRAIEHMQHERNYEWTELELWMNTVDGGGGTTTIRADVKRKYAHTHTIVSRCLMYKEIGCMYVLY